MLDDCDSTVDFGEPVNENPVTDWLTPSADFEGDTPFSDAVTDKEGVRREEGTVRSGLKCELVDAEEAVGRLPLEYVDALRPDPVVEVAGVDTVDTSLA